MQKKNLLGVILFISAANSTTIVLPGTEVNIEKLRNTISEYQAPYKKFKSAGLFMNDPGLSFLELNGNETSVERLVKLSTNHSIAINKRDLEKAKDFASQMDDEMHGRKCGVSEIMVEDEDLLKKITDLKYRCVEQIGLSFRYDEPEQEDTTTTDAVAIKNNEEFKAMYDLARYFTNTPIFFQTVSASMNPKEFVFDYADERSSGKLQQIQKCADTVLSHVISLHPKYTSIIKTTFDIRKQTYEEYLKHVFNILKTTPMSSCCVVDRGQTSEHSYNTCFFNSLFYGDLAARNITSTKMGTLNKATEYISYLKKIFLPLWDKAEVKETLAITGNTDATTKSSETFIVYDIQGNIDRTKADRTYDATWSFSGELYGEKDSAYIFPGVLDFCSVAEMGAMSLGLNFFRTSSSVVHPEFGTSVLSHYTGGFFGSEHFPIAPISHAGGHARSLVKMS